MLVDRRDNVVEALVLGIDNSLIPVEISCNEIYKINVHNEIYS